MKQLKRMARFLKTLLDIDLYYVGGAVRDELMGVQPTDIDVCVVGANREDMQKNLDDFAEFNLFGVTSVTSVKGGFPIWIVEIEGTKYEFAMARTERSTGEKHQDFVTEVEGVTIEEDLKRRDFTINAIAKNILTGELVDPYKGQQHIKEGVLMHVSDAFKEDPLRVFRAARFMARFGFTPSGSLYALCKQMAKDGMKEGISSERVGIELMKVMKTAVKPSDFFVFLFQVDWLNPWFQELSDCIGIPQSPVHHPEGDVITHTMHCIDACKEGDWFTRTVMLCHDLGKATNTSIEEDGRVTSAGHEDAGVQLTINMLKRIHFASHDTIRSIGCLVKHHMLRGTLSYTNHDKMLRRTLRALKHFGLSYCHLVEVTRCDLSGRPPKIAPTQDELDESMFTSHADWLELSGAMKPIVTGDDLIAIGFKQGPEIGLIVKKALELQDRGTLTKDNWLSVLWGWNKGLFKAVINSCS